MHLGVPERGMMWSSAIVASGIPVAVGIAEESKVAQNRAMTLLYACLGWQWRKGVYRGLHYRKQENFQFYFAVDCSAILTKAARTVLTLHTRRVEGWEDIIGEFIQKPHRSNKRSHKALKR